MRGERGHYVEGMRGAPSAAQVFAYARDHADPRRSPRERVGAALDQLGVRHGDVARNRLFGAALNMLERAVREHRDHPDLEPSVPAFDREEALREEAARNWEQQIADGLIPDELLQEIAEGEMAA